MLHPGLIKLRDMYENDYLKCIIVRVLHMKP